MSFQLALIQPRNLVRSWAGHWPIGLDPDAPPETENLDRATACVAKAAEEGARLIVFPELYPGPQNPEEDVHSLEEIARALSAEAEEHGVWILFNGKAPAPGGTFNQAILVNPVGETVVRYNKMIPAVGEPNEAGDTPVVTEIEGVRVGILICWELWFPEVARTLRLKGADLIVAPTGGILYELTANWRTVLRARALENNCYVGMTVNTFGLEEGLCEVAGPEGPVANRSGEGILRATLDMGRLRYMRATDERILVPKPYRAVPGLLRALPENVIGEYNKAAESYLKNNYGE